MQYPVPPYSSSKAGSPEYAFLLSTCQYTLPKGLQLISNSLSPECALSVTPRQ